MSVSAVFSFTPIFFMCFFPSAWTDYSDSIKTGETNSSASSKNSCLGGTMDQPSSSFPTPLEKVSERKLDKNANMKELGRVVLSGLSALKISPFIEHYSYELIEFRVTYTYASPAGH